MISYNCKYTLFSRNPEYIVKKVNLNILFGEMFQLSMINIGRQYGVLKLDFKVY